MAKDINKHTIIGRMGDNPEVNETNGGKTVVNASFATNNSYTNSQGQKVEETEWHRVVFYGGLADIVARHMKKGSRAYIEGRSKTRKWDDKDGVTRYTTEIVATELQMLDGKAAKDAA